MKTDAEEMLERDAANRKERNFLLTVTAAVFLGSFTGVTVGLATLFFYDSHRNSPAAPAVHYPELPLPR
jgi:hypothetical protein